MIISVPAERICPSLDRTHIPDTFFEILISWWCSFIYHRSINPTAQVLVITMLTKEVDAIVIMNIGGIMPDSSTG